MGRMLGFAVVDLLGEASSTRGVCYMIQCDLLCTTTNPLTMVLCTQVPSVCTALVYGNGGVFSASAVAILQRAAAHHPSDQAVVSRL